jgi:hypothetical protein
MTATIATAADVREIELCLSGEIASARNEIHGVELRLSGEIRESELRLRGEITAVRTEIATVRTEMADCVPN